jgi:hypothetical protein
MNVSAAPGGQSGDDRRRAPVADDGGVVRPCAGDVLGSLRHRLSTTVPSGARSGPVAPLGSTYGLAWSPTDFKVKPKVKTFHGGSACREEGVAQGVA